MRPTAVELWCRFSEVELSPADRRAFLQRACRPLFIGCACITPPLMLGYDSGLVRCVYQTDRQDRPGEVV